MATLGWNSEGSVDPERALAIGRGAVEVVTAERPAFLYGAELTGDARALGAWQREEDALAPGPHRVLWRTTGGPAVVAGDGVAYLALALHHGSVFMACPRDRVLNRNVRGLLGGLRSLGLSAHYFGRDTVAVSKAPAAGVAWTRWSDARVLLEIFVGLDRPFAVPEGERALAPPEGPSRAPVALRAAHPGVGAEALTRSVAAAYAAMGGCELEAAPAPAPRPPDRAGFLDRELAWSAPQRIPIGWLRCGLARDASGLVTDAAIAGDFFQDHDAPARLHAALVGGPPSPARLRDAINATYGPHGAVMEGIRSLQPALDGFLELR